MNTTFDSLPPWHRHPQDKELLESALRLLPKRTHPDIRKHYEALYVGVGRQCANNHLSRITEYAGKNRLAPFLDDDAIAAQARAAARTCAAIASAFPDTSEALAALQREVSRRGITLPNNKSAKGTIRRLESAIWWRQKLRRAHLANNERLYRDVNAINRHRSPYASDTAVNFRRTRKARNSALLEKLEATNELGDSFSVGALAAHSLANPAVRRSELMVRIAGFEAYANGHHHVGEFYTFTCPSRMHSSRANSGQPNPGYDGTTPREAHRYLTKLWSLMRSALRRRGINVYGVRVVEPHHDGTPHWHLLLFMLPEHRATVREIFMDYLLRTDGDEQGANSHRFKAVPIDRSKGSAAGYIAKYVAKNIDGFGLNQDERGNSAKSAAERVSTWASSCSIRQFQQIGGPPVSVWRELRRLDPSTIQDAPLATAVLAADQSDWASFLEEMGGPFTRRANLPLSVWRVWTDKKGLYEEPIGMVIAGVLSEEGPVCTRLHEWSVELKKK